MAFDPMDARMQSRVACFLVAPLQWNGFGASLLLPSGTDGTAKPSDRKDPPKVMGGGVELGSPLCLPTLLSGYNQLLTIYLFIYY